MKKLDAITEQRTHLLYYSSSPIFLAELGGELFKKQVTRSGKGFKGYSIIAWKILGHLKLR